MIRRVLTLVFPWLLLGGGLAGWRWWDVQRQREIGRREAELAQLRLTLDGLQQRNAALVRRLAAQQETVTVSVTRWRTVSGPFRVDTLTIARVDTLSVSDSVPRRTVDLLIAAADTTIERCTTALHTCADLTAVKDSIIDAQARTLRLLPKPTPAWRRWTERALWASALLYVSKR